MGTLEEAEEAIRQCNGQRVGDKMIFVKYAKPKQSKGEGEGQSRGNTGGNGGKFGGNRGDKFGGQRN